MPGNAPCPLWALFSAAAFAIGPLVRSMDIPFSTAASFFVAGALACFFLLPLRRGTGSHAGRIKWCRIGIALTAAYLIFAAGMHHSALQHVTEFAAEARLNVQSIAALPLPPSAARWAGLIDTPDGIYRVEFSQFGGEPVHLQFFSQPPTNQYIAAARELKDCKRFCGSRAFPLAQIFRARRPRRRADQRSALLRQSAHRRSRREIATAPRIHV